MLSSSTGRLSSIVSVTGACVAICDWRDVHFRKCALRYYT